MKRVISIALSVLTICSLLAVFSCAPAYGEENNYSVSDYRTTMKFHEDFKILQITDLHFGVESDLELQLGILKKSINEAMPDLIILTGDNFMYSNKSIVKALVSTLNEECKALSSSRGMLTKFAITFGNHDNQGDYPRYFINETIKSYTTNDGSEIADGKFAAFVDYEDDNIFGLTNYFIDIVSPTDENDVKYRIHIIDSNTYKNVGMKYKYDVIHKEQLLHAKAIYESATADKDYIGLAFFHIPLHEYAEAWAQFEASGRDESLGQGVYEEGVLSPYENNGSYTYLRDANISAFFAGHDHINYGDIIYTDKDSQRVIFSYGVKATNQLYHNEEMIGYKTVTLKDNVTRDEFVSGEYIKNNFINVTTGFEYYED